VKKAVKLSRREMKKKIKRLEAIVNMPVVDQMVVRTERPIVPFHCAANVPYNLTNDNDEFLKYELERLAAHLGLDLLGKGLIQVTESFGPLGRTFELHVDVLGPQRRYTMATREELFAAVRLIKKHCDSMNGKACCDCPLHPICDRCFIGIPDEWPDPEEGVKDNAD
jgi:hypothetical protein